MKKINKMQICATSLCIFLVVSVFSTAANGFNQPPVAVDDNYIMDINETSKELPMLDNDYDPDDFEVELALDEPGEIDPTSVVIDEDQTHGIIIVDGETGVVTYTRSNSVLSKMDSFTYKVSDIYGLESNIATVTITFLPGQENTPPVANNDTANVECNEKSILIDVLKNDKDKEDVTPSIDKITKPPKHGDVLISGDKIQYTPKEYFSGIDIFVYQVIDSGGLTGTANVSVTIEPCHENKQPIAENDTANMNKSEISIVIEVLKNDHDPDGNIDSTTVKIVNHPLYGKVCVDIIGGKVKYTRNADSSARSDKFTYTVNDTEGEKSNIATATIIFNQGSENKPPVAENDYVKTDEDLKGKFDVLANDKDVDGDAIKIIKVLKPYHGTATIEENTILTSSIQPSQYISYTPDRDYNGEDKFQYTITDGHGGEDTAIVYINIASVNDPPYIPSNPHPEEGETNVDIAADLSWTGGDPEGDIVTYDIYFGPSDNFQSKSINNQYTSTYNPGTLSYSTTYFWQIVAWDSNTASTEGPVWKFTTENAPSNGDNSGGNDGGTPSVVLNSPPVADASAVEPYHGFIEEVLSFDGSLSFDSDGSIVSWSWNFGDGNVANGEITTHAYSSIGTFLVTLIVTDNQGATGTYKTTSTIVQPNRPPSNLEINGPSACVKDQRYSFVAISTDEDQDNIKYFFDWGDGSIDESEFSPSKDIFAGHFIHSWESAGTYTVTVTVSDNKTTSSSEMSVEVIAPSVDYTVIIILGIIIAVSIIISMTLVKTGKNPKSGKK